MGVFTKVLFILVVLVYTAATANAQIIGTEDSSDIKATVDTLNEDIIELRLLSETIKTVQENGS